MNTSTVQSIIEQIRKLNTDELELILKEVFESVERKKRITLALDNFIGTGKGIWNLDAQEYVNSLREEDR
ncbi:hypothetical protein ACE193_19395 [Bernardetia sp. OM2101]|uniref:hypothetical protein n=1 Tax=Bernardetia sp. OM2101 TaxID=3344876 RepID=UPI0035CED912